MGCINGGRVWDVACQDLCKWEGKRESGKKSKRRRFLLPLLHVQGKKNSAFSKWHRSVILSSSSFFFFFFFEKKEMNLGVTQKNSFSMWFLYVAHCINLILQTLVNCN